MLSVMRARSQSGADRRAPITETSAIAAAAVSAKITPTLHSPARLSRLPRGFLSPLSFIFPVYALQPARCLYSRLLRPNMKLTFCKRRAAHARDRRYGPGFHPPPRWRRGGDTVRPAPRARRFVLLSQG